MVFGLWDGRLAKILAQNQYSSKWMGNYKKIFVPSGLFDVCLCVGDFYTMKILLKP